MHYNLRYYLLIVGISVLLVVLGHAVILHRTPASPYPELVMAGDSDYYFAMAEGRAGDVPIPFRYRVLVPFIARLLPLDLPISFMLITYLSLFVCYILALITCRKLGLYPFASIVGLFALFTTSAHLYNYHNPYLTDALALAALFAMFAMLVKRSFSGFMASLVVGVLARETIIFLSPIWLMTKEWRKGAAAILIAIIAFVVPRLALSAHNDPSVIQYTAAQIRDIWGTGDLLHFFRYLYSTWHMLWLLMPIGLILMPWEKWSFPAAAFVILFIGAALSSVVAFDMLRMFSILSPVVVVSCAFLFSSLWARSRVVAILFIALLAIKLFIGLPTVATPPDSWACSGKLPVHIYYALGMAYSLLVVLLLRGPIMGGVKEKAARLSLHLSQIKKKEC